MGTDGTLWEIGKKGRVFRYDTRHDCFQLVYKLPDETVKGTPTPVSYGFIDSNNVVWLCSEQALYLYDTRTGKTEILKNHIGENITDIEQIDSTHYFIGTDVGIHHAELKDSRLALSSFSRSTSSRCRSTTCSSIKKAASSSSAHSRKASICTT